MITASQILAHLWGDFLLQSNWMAENKTKRNWPAYCHVFTYMLPFLLFRPSVIAMLFMFWSHFFIDRYRLARYVVWAKNWMAPWSRTLWEQRMVFSNCSRTGYVNEERNGPPSYMSVWLLIIADNILHLTCNGLALKYL